MNEDETRPYKLVTSHHYPMRRETRSREKIIFDEANYKLYTIAEASPAWQEQESSFIDLRLLLDYEKISEQNPTIEELCDILQENGFKVEATPDNDSFGVYVPWPEENESNNSEQDGTYLLRYNVYTLHSVLKPKKR